MQQNKPTQQMKELMNLDKSINRRARFIGNFGISFIVPTIILSISLYYYFGRSSYENSGLSEILRAAIVVLTLILITSLFIIMSANTTSKIAKLPQTDEEKQRKLVTSLRIVTVIWSAYLYIFLLEQGYLDVLAEYLNINIFPALSEGVNYVISNLVGWAISGAIGNLFYDILKRLVNRKRQQDKGSNPRRTNKHM